MANSAFPTFSKWLASARGVTSANGATGTQNWLWPRYPTWRLSTWWPGDTRPAMYHSLLHILAIAHAQRLDLVPLVNNLAAEHRGRYRRALRRLASRLESGVPLVAALEQTPEVLSEPMLLAIRFGSQSGALAATYDELLRSRTPEAIQLQAATRSELIYWSILLVAIASALSYLMGVIAPKYIDVAEELGLELPATFWALIAISNHVARYPLLWTAIALLVAWLIWSARSRKFFRRAIAQRVLDPAGQGRLVELLQLLAIAVETGRPIPGSLSTLARYHFDRQLRQKLLYARNEVEQGVDVWDSLAGAKILSATEAGALASSPSASARVWILRRLAAWKQAINHRRSATALALIRPVVVLLLAGIVLWVASAFFGALPSFVLFLG